jgi:hypothetical protein
VIIVAYETPDAMLRECLRSIGSSTYDAVEVLVIDNSASATVEETVAAWTRVAAPEDRRVFVERQSKNVGYAAATNRGIARSSGELLLLLNPDTVLSPDAIAALVEAAERRPTATGFAPKVILAANDLIIDSVGLDLFLQGQGAQRGLGEPDIGQYDIEEQVAGLCFASAMIRRSAFSRQAVGPLDERFFMFYEDVDWSIRAAIRGREFWSVPSAQVRHVHSASTRHMPGSFKTRLIRRNLLWTAAKNLEGRRVAATVARISARTLLVGAANHELPTALRTVTEGWIGLPALARARREVQKSRLRSDRSALTAPHDTAAFDATNYRPVPSVDTLVAVLTRLHAVTLDPVLEKLLFRISVAEQSSTSFAARQITSLVRESGVPIRPGLEWMLAQLEVPATKISPS